MKSLAPKILVCLALAGCAQSSMGTSQTTGGLVGGLAGGLIGSRFGSGTGKLLAVGTGAVVGALLGSELGKKLDDNDKRQMESVNQRVYSAPIGQPIEWQNPSSGNRGTIMATREGTSQSGEYCREFTQTIVVGGQTQSAYGVACRQHDGAWKIVQ